MDNRISIAFLGGIYPDDTSALQNESKVSLDYAADAYQKKYLKCIRNISDVKIFSRLFVGSWPICYKRITVKNKGKSEYGDVNYIKYFNLVLFRELSQKRNTVRAVKKWYDSQDKNTSLVLFVYSTSFSKEIVKLKKICPKLKICLIIPDLPAFTFLSDNSKLRIWLKNKREADFEVSCRYSDCCICITEAMRAFVSKKANIQTTVIEAIADKERCRQSLKRIAYREHEKDENDIKVILYTGTLAKKYGIEDLLNAFQMLKRTDCELWICGGGDAEEEIQNAQCRDNRIKYFGVISNDEAKRMQDEANILVNPRSSEGDYTSYSFPSKIMEYLETGNTVICHRLPGIPKEYQNLLNYTDGAGAEALFRVIDKALSESVKTRTERGKYVLNYLLEEKCGNTLVDVLHLIMK